MKISKGSTLSKFDFLTKIGGQIVKVTYNNLFIDKTVALFGMPGAFTPTCSNYHIPSVKESEPSLRKKGVDIIAIVTTNDPHVTEAWGLANNLNPDKIMLLSDAESKFTEASGMIFSAPEIGLIRRSQRYALIAINGTVKSLQIENSRGVCKISSGESLIENTDWLNEKS